MQLEARVKAVVDLIDIFLQTKTPFDIVLHRYLRDRKWIGSADRRAIAEFSYAIFRNFEKLKFVTSKITNDFGRFFVLAYMRSVKHFSDRQIEEIFSGRQYAPGKLSAFEKKFISNLPLDFSSDKYPDHVQLNYPKWLEPHLRRAFDEKDFRDEMLAFNETASTDLRVNTLLATKDGVKELLKDFDVEDMKYAKNGLRIKNARIGRNNEAINRGFVEIQDEGSQLISEICCSFGGSTIIDYCAGAGGKTLAISALMNNKGRIFALDKYPERLQNAKQRLKRANSNNVFCQEITSKWLKRHQQVADVVLVDAPCSGTGTWRRNPDMRAKFLPNDLEELVTVQQDILSTAEGLVKPGGHLIYSTCSILLEENEDQIAKFLQKFQNYRPCKIDLKSYSGDFLKLSPFRNKTDGFFAAVLEKK